jgi:hypothetical protein
MNDSQSSPLMSYGDSYGGDPDCTPRNFLIGVVVLYIIFVLCLYVKSRVTNKINSAKVDARRQEINKAKFLERNTYGGYDSVRDSSKRSISFFPTRQRNNSIKFFKTPNTGSVKFFPVG